MLPLEPFDPIPAPVFNGYFLLLSAVHPFATFVRLLSFPRSGELRYSLYSHFSKITTRESLMLSTPTLKQWLAGVALGSISALTLAADQCGEAPAAPAIPEGATATLEELAAAAEQVNQYGELSNTYLDCVEEFTGKRAFKQLSRDEQAAIHDKFSTAAASHNATLDAFQAELEAFRAANPE